MEKSDIAIGLFLLHKSNITSTKKAVTNLTLRQPFLFVN